MKIGRLNNLIIYGLIVVASLVLLYLAAISPEKFLDTSSIYQGF